MPDADPTAPGAGWPSQTHLGIGDSQRKEVRLYEQSTGGGGEEEPGWEGHWGRRAGHPGRRRMLGHQMSNAENQL